MMTVKLKFAYLPLLLLWLWLDRCVSLNDSSLPAIFYPFGIDEGDRVVIRGDDICNGPINIPYQIFNSTSLYVSLTRMTLHSVSLLQSSQNKKLI